jgi:trans-AT polyketide synthase, acyltransferase and oxidoreductase domains
MLTYIFPGQGSQQKGMGGALFDEFKELTAKADQILGFSIKELCFEDPNLQLSQTQYTQPALFVVNALSYLKKIKERGRRPDYVAGHSLGEYNALFAAGAFDFETGLKLVKRRGEMMSRATGGGMAAIIGLNEEEVEEALAENGFASIDIANLNTPSQIVIAGPKEDIDFAKSIFEAIKSVKMYAPLKVSGAFHSRYMSESKKEYEKFIDTVQFSQLTIPVISNVQARPYKQAEIKKNLAEQVAHSVKWSESIRYLMGLGEMEFEEVGPGKVLTGMVQRIQREAEPLVIKGTGIEAKDDQKIPEALTKDAPTLEMAQAKKDRPEEKVPIGDDGKEERLLSNPPVSLGKVITGAVRNVHEKAKALMAVNTVNNEETREKSREEQTSKAVSPEKDKKQENRKKGTPNVYPKISATSLGNEEFRQEYNLKYAYVTGGMYQGISSAEMVIKIGKAGMMGFLGTGGLELTEIERAIKHIQKELNHGQAYGVNLLYNPVDPDKEEQTVDLFLTYGVRNVEASAYLGITPSLVRYRLKGLTRNQQGGNSPINKIMAKVSRPEMAEAFLSPPPERIVTKLLAENKISQEEAELSKRIPMADDLCVEADSGGHTDGGVTCTLMPAMLKLRNDLKEKHGYSKKVRVGAAGGIGTPEAAAAAYILGADFVLTGSINQCTVEAGTSDLVKDLLQQMNVRDTEYAPAGDMFELGAKAQVFKKGLFFPARANKLYELYRQHNSLSEIDDKTKLQIQEKYFKRSFEKIYEEVKSHNPIQEIERAEQSPKYKMALIFRWYFGYCTQLALSGNEEYKVDYQVFCGPALGAFNQWVKGTTLENWRNRHVDEIGEKLMEETAEFLNRQLQAIIA